MYLMNLGWSVETRLMQKTRLHFYVLETNNQSLKLEYQLIYSNGKNIKYVRTNLEKKIYGSLLHEELQNIAKRYQRPK